MIRTHRILQRTSRLPFRGPPVQQRAFWRRAPNHDPQLTVQPVRIRTWWSAKRFATYAMYAAGTGLCLQWFLADIEVEVEVIEDQEHHAEHSVNNDEGEEGQLKEGEEGQEGGAVEEEEFEGDEDAIFIPLTMAKKMPREYYKGSDPEWQEFRKIAPDKQRVQRVFAELSDMIGSGLLQHRSTAKVLGKNATIRRYWLDIQFPDGPPQDYMRKGLEIGSNYIAISEQVIPADHYERMSHILWPSGAVNGLYDFWNTIFVLRWRKMKEALGMDTTAKPGSLEYKMDRMVQMIRALEANKDQQKTQIDPSGRAAGSDSAASQRSESEQIDLKPGSRWYLPGIPAFPGDTAENTVATMSFVHSIAQMRNNKTPAEPPRGSFIILGMLQATGSQACITFDVLAFYDPKLAKFSSVTVKPKSVKLWKQSPRGGP